MMYTPAKLCAQKQKNCLFTGIDFNYHPQMRVESDDL